MTRVSAPHWYVDFNVCTPSAITERMLSLAPRNHVVYVTEMHITWFLRPGSEEVQPLAPD